MDAAWDLSLVEHEAHQALEQRYLEILRSCGDHAGEVPERDRLLGEEDTDESSGSDASSYHSDSSFEIELQEAGASLPKDTWNGRVARVGLGLQGLALVDFNDPKEIHQDCVGNWKLDPDVTLLATLCGARCLWVPVTTDRRINRRD